MQATDAENRQGLRSEVSPEELPGSGRQAAQVSETVLGKQPLRKIQVALLLAIQKQAIQMRKDGVVGVVRLTPELFLALMNHFNYSEETIRRLEGEQKDLHEDLKNLSARLRSAQSRIEYLLNAAAGR